MNDKEVRNAVYIEFKKILVDNKFRSTSFSGTSYMIINGPTYIAGEILWLYDDECIEMDWPEHGIKQCDSPGIYLVAYSNKIESIKIFLHDPEYLIKFENWVQEPKMLEDTLFRRSVCRFPSRSKT